MRARLLLGVPIALVIGCSLAVDTSGLSGGGTASVPNDGATPETSTGVDAAVASDASDASDASVDSGNGCPAGRGPSMVRITDKFGAFCIDSTEVTQTQFNAFLADTAPRPTPPSACAYRTSYGGAQRPADLLPVVDVDWCEAWMFCAWAGKRLCGSRNGTAIGDFGPANDPKISEWFAACSATGSRKFPYGDTVKASACNGDTPLVPVGSLATCEGGYPGVFDMAGNASEWEDNCDGTASGPPAMAECPPRGDRAATADAMTCALTVLPASDHRQDRSAGAGIRCCSN